ncbi:MAG: retropepsin-like aspartic protease [Flavobacterium sp.]
MNKLFTLFAVLLLLPLIANSQTKTDKKALKEATKNRDKYLYAAKPVQKNFTHTLPFETTVRGHIILPVMIEGKAYRFLFDTGALTLVSSELKDKLGLKSIYTTRLEDAAGQIQEHSMYGIGQMQLGPVVFKDVAGAAINLEKIEKQFCEKVDGLLGTNIMRTCHWKIDYKNKTVTFSDKEIKPEGSFTTIDFVESFSGSPLLLQKIGEHTYYSTMDTGAGGGFRISDSLFFNTRKSKGAKLAIGRGNSAMTLFEGKPSYEYTTIVDSIYVGNNLITNQLLSVQAGESYITGNKFFAKFGSVQLDWKKKKIYLPATTIAVDTGFTSLGLLPLYVGDELQVGMVWENSADGINEIEPGDTIISIDNIVVQNLTREKWCEIVDAFSSDGDTGPLPVTVRKKDGAEKQLILKKTDLLKR